MVQQWVDKWSIVLKSTKELINYLKSMTKRLQSTPRHWLSLETCGRIFEIFRKRWEFDEPIPGFDTRYPGRLEGILESVRQTYGGKYLNHALVDAAAAYLNQLVRGHAMQNGNKRMAVLFTHTFLLVNGVDLTLTPEDMYNLAVTLARAGESGISGEETKEWCKEVITDFSADFK